MTCSHLATKAIYENKKLTGYKCIACDDFLPKEKVFPHLRNRKPTPIKKENKILDDALDHYEQTLRDLVNAITQSVDCGKIDHKPCSVINLEHIKTPLYEAKKLLEQ